MRIPIAIARIGAPILAILTALPARAANTTPSRLPSAVAIVPGVVVHGSGHFAAGESRTGWLLLATEGVGIALAAGSLAGIAATGASRRTIAPLAVLTVTGVSLFAFSFLADVYGATTRGEKTGTPLRENPIVETRGGARVVYDPQFKYGILAEQSVALRAGPLRGRGEAWQASAARASRLAAIVAYRWRCDRETPDGSYVDAEAGATRLAYSRDGFATNTYELALAGRLDLQRVGRTLRGSFVGLRLGAALVSHRYAGAGAGADDMMLLRTSYGIYLGRFGEVALFYDHRRDTIVGGGLLRGIAAGYLGFGGIEGKVFVDPAWGVAFDAAIGGAYTAGLSVIFRQGAVAW